MGRNNLTDIGKITFASGIALVGDPCYIKDKSDVVWLLGETSKKQDYFESDAGFAFRVPTTPANVLIEATRHYNSGRMLVSFTGHDFRDWHPTEIGTADVDSGQMMASDIARVITDYHDNEYQDIRIFRHKNSGRQLQYGVDFDSYLSKIASENDATIEDLLETGEWEQLPEGDDQFDFTYNGVCKHNKRADYSGALIGDYAVNTSSGGGDGSYPVILYHDSDRNLLGFMIDFITPEDNEDDYEE